MQGLYDNFHKGRERAGDATPGWEDLRDRARAVKAHTIEHLDYYLDMAASNVEKAGGSVFFAEDAASATQYILDLARARGVKTVVKGKSHALRGDGAERAPRAGRDRACGDGPG